MEWTNSKKHRDVKGLENQNLRDHMTEAELIFTALAGKKGGKIAKDARLRLEKQTGRKVITGENFLPPSKQTKRLSK